MKKIIYISLFAIVTSISISAHSEKNTISYKVQGPIGGLVSDPK